MLTHLTSSPHFYQYIYLAVAVLVILNIAEIMLLLAHKRSVERLEARKDELKHRISTAMITVTDPSAVLPEPADPIEYAAYSESLSSILESFAGEIAVRAAQVLRKFRIDSYFRGLTRDSAWYKRAGAIDILATFRMKTNRDFFLTRFRSEKNIHVKYRILYGLSLLIRDREEIYTLSKMLSTLPYLTAKYTEDIFFNIITALKQENREEEFGAFLHRIMLDKNVLPLVKRDCLTACYAASCEKAAEIISRYYLEFRKEPEIPIACIKAMIRMGNFSILHESLFHPDWRVRLTGLKFAHLSPVDLRGDLKRMLHDPNYHIRVNSAMALAKLKEPGLEVLRAESVSKDKFAADAALYALSLAEAAR